MDQCHFYIKYKGPNPENSSQIDLVELGNSIAGLDPLLNKIFAASKINGDLEVKANKIEDGCILIDLLMQVDQAAGALPFDNVQDLLNFLQFVDHAQFLVAQQFFDNITDTADALDKYWSAHPFRAQMLTNFVTLAIAFSKQLKTRLDLIFNGRPVSPKLAKGLQKTVKSKSYKKVLHPFTEDHVSSIEFSTEKTFRSPAKIDNSNFESYLPEDEAILPKLENGDVVAITGTIVGMQHSRGDTLKFQFSDGSKKHTLVTYPKEGETTKDYADYYTQDTLLLTAEVVRLSMYKKPKLKVVDIQESQLQMDLEEK